MAIKPNELGVFLDNFVQNKYKELERKSKRLMDAEIPTELRKLGIKTPETVTEHILPTDKIEKGLKMTINVVDEQPKIVAADGIAQIKFKEFVDTLDKEGKGV